MTKIGPSRVPSQMTGADGPRNVDVAGPKSRELWQEKRCARGGDSDLTQVNLGLRDTVVVCVSKGPENGTVSLRNRTKKMMRYTAAFLLVFHLTVAPSTPALAFNVFLGQQAYKLHCVRCHGVDGRPMVAGTPDFALGQTLNNPDNVLFEAIKRGKNLMPGYDRVISDTEVFNVIAYLRTLQR